MIKLIKRIFPGLRNDKSEPAKETAKEVVRRRLDPLDFRHRSGDWDGEDVANKSAGPKILTVGAFPFAELNKKDSAFKDGRTIENGEMRRMAMDGKMVTYAMDDCSTGASCGMMGGDIGMSAYTVPTALMSWFSSQSFIGYQACAIIAQHWLVDKACSMAGEDAIRNGWEIKARGDEQALTDSQLQTIKQMDEKFNLMEEMKELNRFKNIFGIRVLLFKVDSDDPKYYEKPFNIDGVDEGAYKGISQVDPYWMMPMMTAESTADPSSPHFYDPEYWVISGKRYHRSHLIIVRGPEPADLLKPTYIFGGIPLTQRIYERVYAAERTANEAPLLATNKRTTAIHVDMEKAVADQSAFENRLMMWIKYRDNHAVKVLGEEESMEQFDTSLSDFDSVIMNQFQLVAAIAKTPATKLLGTSPKGFNATGEHETISYHEELESIQKHVMSPFLERHYMLLMKSLGLQIEIIHVWEPVDSITMEQRANLNKIKAEMGQILINDGTISPDEERNRIRDDKHSGYNRLQDDDAETEPGMSPENLAKFEKNDADQEKAEAAQTMAGAKAEAVGEAPAEAAQESAVPFGRGPVRTQPGQATTAPGGQDILASALQSLAGALGRLEDRLLPNGHDETGNVDHSSMHRSTRPSVKPSTSASIDGPGSVVGSMPGHKLPKLKLHGMTMAIENPRGTIRKGMDINGDGWSQKMPHHYGFIRGTKGADDEEMDCFIGPNADSQKVFVINQNDAEGSFDEHKCMIGFGSAAEAKDAYSASFASDWKGFDSIVPMSMDQFKKWLKDGDCYSPLSAACIAKTTSTPMVDSAMDKNEFKESDHPRAPNGQFGKGSGGGASSSGSASKESGAGKEQSVFKVNKELGSKKDALPKVAKELTAKNGGVPPTPEQFHEAVTQMGFNIIPAQSVKYLKMYLKEQKAASGESKTVTKTAEKPVEKQAEKQPASPKSKEEKIAQAGKAAEANGYKKEGTYNGIEYFKDGAGDKVSYKSDTDTWVAIAKGTKTVTAQGSGVESFEKYVAANKGKEAAPNTMAKAPVSVHHTATESAKKYGDVIPESKFGFSSKGIANEKALPSKVQASILAYKGNEYTVINNAMRYSESFDPATISPKTMADILNLQRAFSAVAPSQKDATVGRKIGLEGLKSMVKDAGVSDLDHLKEGMVLRDPGIISTSHSAHVWSGEVKFEIKLPKGSKVIDISETIKKNQGEDEVLLGPDSKLKITGVKKNEGSFKYHITCELVQ